MFAQRVEQSDAVVQSQMDGLAVYGEFARKWRARIGERRFSRFCAAASREQGAQRGRSQETPAVQSRWLDGSGWHFGLLPGKANSKPCIENTRIAPKFQLAGAGLTKSCPD